MQRCCDTSSLALSSLFLFSIKLETSCKGSKICSLGSDQCERRVSLTQVSSVHEAVQLIDANICVQSRFTDLIREKADLKERVEELEHRCIQLSGETDTIGTFRPHQHKLKLAQCIIYLGNRRSPTACGAAALLLPSSSHLLLLPNQARSPNQGWIC